jgi:hypothetical protein
MMNELLIFLSGGAVALLIVKIYSDWRASEQRGRRQHAIEVLRTSGLSVHRYNSCIGIDNKALQEALSEFQLSGEIIMNDYGEVVGGVVPKMVAATDRSHLRLVVSNSTK